jgi:type I restriction enzyme R subunit
MYDLAQQYWAQAIKAEQSALASDTQQEAAQRRQKIAWMEETEMAVVVSQEQNEVATFGRWGLDIKSHRKKMNERELDKDFKDAGNPLRIVFVCAMWLTGFDVKPLSVMYFDKPMKAHTLMQAIARANRVNEGKSNGLIVDYIGVVKALRKALAEYTVDPGTVSGVNPVADKSELLQRIADVITEIEGFLASCGYQLEVLLTADGFERLHQVQVVANSVSRNDESKKRFGVLARELFKLFKYINWQEVEHPVLTKRDAIDAVYKELNKRRDVADTGDIMVKLQQIVDEHITVQPPVEGQKLSVKFDISAIDFNRLHQEFAKVERKNLLLNDLRTAIETRLNAALRVNSKRADFFTRYQAIIDEYNKEQDRATIEKTFADLMRLAKDLDDAQKSYVEEGFTNPQQQAVFDLLFKDTLTKPEIFKIKALSIDLVDIIQERLSHMTHWTEKPETRAEVLTIIRDELYRKLPENCSEADIAMYRQEIFNYFYTRAAA